MRKTCQFRIPHQLYTPLDAEQTRNHTFGLLSVRRPKLPGLLELAWPVLVWFTEHIFAEDRAIVEWSSPPTTARAATGTMKCSRHPRLRALLAANGLRPVWVGSCEMR